MHVLVIVCSGIIVKLYVLFPEPRASLLCSEASSKPVEINAVITLL